MKVGSLNSVQFLEKIILICLITLCITNTCSAQKPTNLEDSVRYYINLSNENWHNNIEFASKIAKENYLLSQKLDNPALKAAAIAQYGIAFYSHTAYDSALHYYNKAIQVAADNQQSVTPYLLYKLAVLGKKSEYLDIIHSIDEFALEEDSLKIDLLLTQINAALEIGLTQKADSALQVIEQYRKDNIGKEYKLKIAKLNGAYFSKTGDFATSDSILAHVLDNYLESSNYLDAAEVYLLLANNAMSLSQYKLSMDYLQKAEALYENVNYAYGLAQVLLEKATLYSYLNEFNTSSEQLFNALEFFEENNNLNKIQRINYELGWLHFKKDLFVKANDYANKSIAIAKKINNISGMGASYSLKGLVKMNLGENDSAIYYHDLSIYNYQQTGNKRSVATVLFNKAGTLLKIGKESKAIKIYKDTYQIYININYLLGMAVAERVIGEFYLKNNSLDSAIYYLDKSENKILNLSDDTSLLGIYKSKAEYYSRIGEIKRANEYLNKSLDLQESIFDKQKESIFLELSTVYDLKNKEKELAYLNSEKEIGDKVIALNKQKIKSQQYTLTALSIGLVLLLILIYFIFKYTRVKVRTNKELQKLYCEIQEKQEEIMAQSEELQESNDRITDMNNILENKVLERTYDMRKAHAELDKFFYRASHDFRGPLTTMMGLVEVSKLINKDPEISYLFENVNQTAKKLDKMVRKLQSVSFLSDLHDLSEPQPFNLHLLLDEIKNNFIKEYPDKKINFEIEIFAPKMLVFYPDLLEICLKNLIENSIIFNKNEQINIGIFIKIENDQLLVTVEDNGVGIDEEWQDNIFEMFEKSSDISKGNGLGLYLVKKAISKLNGKINFESTFNVGSKFYLQFSINQSTNSELSEFKDAIPNQ